jgi:CRP-like cAMP-binding protein
MTIKLSLTSVPVFQFVSPEHTQRLAGIAKVVDKARNEAVLMHGETVPGIYIVGEGHVGVYPPGQSKPLVTLGRGDSFGEMSFLEKTKASATIRAEGKGTKLVVMLQHDLAVMADAEAELGRALYRGIALTLSQKLRATTDKIASELSAGRKLLANLAAEDAGATPFNLAGLPDEVIQQNQLVTDNLDAAVRLAEELARRVPEKAGTVNTLQMKLGEAKSHCITFYPRLARHIAAITAFIRSMEDFLRESAHD